MRQRESFFIPMSPWVLKSLQDLSEVGFRPSAEKEHNSLWASGMKARDMKEDTEWRDVEEAKGTLFLLPLNLSISQLQTSALPSNAIQQTSLFYSFHLETYLRVYSLTSQGSQVLFLISGSLSLKT